MQHDTLRATTRHARAGALLLALALGRCSDRLGLVQPPAEGPRRSVTTEHPEWRGYWRSGTELWVYDMTPEVGMQTFFGDGTPVPPTRGKRGGTEKFFSVPPRVVPLRPGREPVQSQRIEYRCCVPAMYARFPYTWMLDTVSSLPTPETGLPACLPVRRSMASSAWLCAST